MLYRDRRRLPTIPQRRIPAGLQLNRNVDDLGEAVDRLRKEGKGRYPVFIALHAEANWIECKSVDLVDDPGVENSPYAGVVLEGDHHE